MVGGIDAWDSRFYGLMVKFELLWMGIVDISERNEVGGRMEWLYFIYSNPHCNLTLFFLSSSKSYTDSIAVQLGCSCN
jgi:hypothetical protein